MANRVSIQISRETKDLLSRYGNLSSTYDSVIRELIDHVQGCDKWWANKE